MTISVLAPAKINLGLEVIGQRPDGFHEIKTVMQTVSIYDRIEIAPSSDIEFFVDDAALASERNLALKAAKSLAGAVDQPVGATIALRKRIPTAAGLGGASSDAAATLTGLARLWRLEGSRQILDRLALELGSDVPFLLKGGTAQASGRGEEIEALSPLRHYWFVVVTPPISIAEKTKQLYGALEARDFSSGSRIQLLARGVNEGGSIDPTLLANAFERPLAELQPEIAKLRKLMLEAGAPFVALSGSGPTHYALTDDFKLARQIALGFRALAGPEARIMVCRPVRQAPLVSDSDD